ncbi:MAG TPA: 2-oxoglutarate dehydrogenase complex dihydrolipoyllysine-residue succinyltransferase [Gammaproteobacteria bacterium]
MAIEIKVPDFPESVADGTIVAWHKHPGDVVKRDDLLVEIETDKVVFEVPAITDGVLQEILVNEGATVVSGQVLTHIDPAGTQAASSASTGKTESTSSWQTPQDDIITPSARKLIAEHNLDSNKISGSGRGGRVLKEDVLRAMEKTASQPASTGTRTSVTSGTTGAMARAATTTPLGDRPQKRVPMTRLRTRIAERLVEAQHTAAILTTFNEVNMQPVMDLRQKYKDKFEKEHGVRLGFMSFFVKASIEALKQFPEVNASIDGNDIIYHGFFDIGIAVGSPRGLVVPILRDADTLTMAKIEAQIGDYAKKAGDGTLAIEEITGGTFTITNGGIFGSLLSTPILNPPQSGILGMHKIQPRPVVENGEIVIRPMMYLALSYDHRIIDGREAVQFLVTIKELLEDPARILLDI